MVQLIRVGSEAENLSFFPAPYPDECYYSILCRYMVHSGLPSTRETMRTLFGKDLSALSTLLMPYYSSRVPKWVNAETGITENTLIRDHTAFYYISISFRTNESEANLKRIRIGEKAACCGLYRTGYRKNIASDRLRFCPLCAYEEKVKYGEMYWHRTHQLKGNHVCIKHKELLVDSKIEMKKIKRSLVPASSALKDYYSKSLQEVGDRTCQVPSDLWRKHKLIQEDIMWLMQHGMEAGGLQGITSRYKNELAARGLTDGRSDRISDLPGLLNAIREYFGAGFLESLNLPKYEFLEWKETPIVVANFLSPLEHVLLMEFLCGSADKFVRLSV